MPPHKPLKIFLITTAMLFLFGGLFVFVRRPSSVAIVPSEADASVTSTLANTARPTLDTLAYDAKLLQIANLTTLEKVVKIKATSSTPSSTIITTSTIPKGWPVKTVYPNAGALLPFNRIVAYYGNLYTTQMGVLGKYPAPQMLAMLASTTAQWFAADPTTPIIPALDYIAVVAQASAGKDGKYRARMPDSEIDKVLKLAEQAKAIVIFDIQVGLSSVQDELLALEPYLKLPQVHVALDPEFAMKNGRKPGTFIGSMDATEINWAANYLAKLVRENNLPPKVLIVHRFTEEMVTNSKQITPLPEVQIVIDMDGFGNPETKIGTYTRIVVPQPVQFTGFKLFYKNDAVSKGGHLMSPAEVLRLSPRPSFIQYQ